MKLTGNRLLRGFLIAAIAAQPVVVCPLAALTIVGQTARRRAPNDIQLARRAIAAVGLILVADGVDSAERALPRGSGVVVRKDGLVATSFHVIARSNRAARTESYDHVYFRLETGQTYKLKLLAADKNYDLALLRVEPGSGQRGRLVLPAVEIAEAGETRLLDDLVIIGFPETGGSTVTVNVGVVEGIDKLGAWIKTDARLIHGNSGGAAVNKQGKLVGIPTKVVVDRDTSRQYGAVGFLRPAHLVTPLIAGAPAINPTAQRSGVETLGSRPPANRGQDPVPGGIVTVQGMIRSAADGKPVAGARVGLVPRGTANVTENNLISWGGTDPNGLFVLNRPVSPGRYTLRAKAIGYELLSLEIDIVPNTGRLTVDLKPSR